jgi:hypothetical protein
MAPDGSERLTNRQSDRSTSASGSPERVAQVRTHRTAPLDQSVADPSSLPVSRPQDRMNQRTPCASTGEFFNTVGAKRTLTCVIRSTVPLQCGARRHSLRGSSPEIAVANRYGSSDHCCNRQARQAVNKSSQEKATACRRRHHNCAPGAPVTRRPFRPTPWALSARARRVAKRSNSL